MMPFGKEFDEMDVVSKALVVLAWCCIGASFMMMIVPSLVPHHYSMADQELAVIVSMLAAMAFLVLVVAWQLVVLAAMKFCPCVARRIC